MTSDLKPRKVNAKRKLNVRFYAVLSVLVIVVYLLYMTAQSETIKKSASAASSITKGIHKVTPNVDKVKEVVTDAAQKVEKKVVSHKLSESDEAYDPKNALQVLLETYEIIIFSKSTCPHSKRAKQVFALYDIRPPPLIYELDVEAHGLELQKVLGQQTKRSTVPNVLVKGTSIGGGDEIVALHEEGKLIAKVRALSASTDITKRG